MSAPDFFAVIEKNCVAAIVDFAPIKRNCSVVSFFLSITGNKCLFLMFRFSVQWGHFAEAFDSNRRC